MFLADLTQNSVEMNLSTAIVLQYILNFSGVFLKGEAVKCLRDFFTHIDATTCQFRPELSLHAKDLDICNLFFFF